MATVRERYSAEVNIYLQVNGERLPASHVGPDSITLRAAQELPPTTAQVVLIIDGHERVRDVFLFEGVKRETRCVRFR
jgi:hypothetical protein